MRFHLLSISIRVAAMINSSTLLLIAATCGSAMAEEPDAEHAPGRSSSSMAGEKVSRTGWAPSGYNNNPTIHGEASYSRDGYNAPASSERYAPAHQPQGTFFPNIRKNILNVQATSSRPDFTWKPATSTQPTRRTRLIGKNKHGCLSDGGRHCGPGLVRPTVPVSSATSSSPATTWNPEPTSFSSEAPADEEELIQGQNSDPTVAATKVINGQSKDARVSQGGVRFDADGHDFPRMCTDGKGRAVKRIKLINFGTLTIDADSFSGCSKLQWITIENVGQIQTTQKSFNFRPVPAGVQGRSSNVDYRVTGTDLNSLVSLDPNCVKLILRNVTFRAGSPLISDAKTCVKSVEIVDSRLERLSRRAIDGVVTELLSIRNSHLPGGISSTAFSNIKTNKLEILNNTIGSLEDNAISDENVEMVESVTIQGNMFTGHIQTSALNFGVVKYLHFQENEVNVSSLGEQFLKAQVGVSGHISNNHFNMFERRAFASIEAANSSSSVVLTFVGNTFPSIPLDQIRIGRLLEYSSSFTGQRKRVITTDTHVTRCSCELFDAVKSNVDESNRIMCMDATSTGLATRSDQHEHEADGVRLSAYGKSTCSMSKEEKTRLKLTIWTASAAGVFLFLVAIGSMMFMCCCKTTCRRGCCGGGRRFKRSNSRNGTEKSSWLFEKMRWNQNGSPSSTFEGETLTRDRMATRENSNNDSNFGSRRSSGNGPTVVYAIPETRLYQMSTAVEQFETAEEFEFPVIFQPVLTDRISSADSRRLSGHEHNGPMTVTDGGTGSGAGMLGRGTLQRLGVAHLFGNSSRRKSRAESDQFRFPGFARGSIAAAAKNSRGESLGVTSDVTRRPHQTLDI